MTGTMKGGRKPAGPTTMKGGKKPKGPTTMKGGGAPKTRQRTRRKY